MKFNLTETVVLIRDIEEYGLKKGDLGVIVEVYGKSEYEVEFVTPTGYTQALLSLNEKDIRHVSLKDMFTVRHLQQVA